MTALLLVSLRGVRNTSMSLKRKIKSETAPFIIRLKLLDTQENEFSLRPWPYYCGIELQDRVSTFLKRYLIVTKDNSHPIR